MDSPINDHTVILFPSKRQDYKPDVLKKMLENKEAFLDKQDGKTVLINKEIGKADRTELMNMRAALKDIQQNFGTCTQKEYMQQREICSAVLKHRIEKWDDKPDIPSMAGF